MHGDTNKIRATIEAQGRRLDWVAAQMGISQGHLTRLLNGQRRWLPHLRSRISEVLGVPEGVLFFDPDDRQTDDNVSVGCQEQESVA
jgi:transcriptional regulator with XRE-family HTH domain